MLRPQIFQCRGAGVEFGLVAEEGERTRLGVEARSPAEDVALANAAFAALGEGGAALRWEPFFFDWFGGPASESRALNGPRAGLYAGEAATAFRALIAAYEPRDADRLGRAYFAGPEPQELLYDEIEAIWAAVAERDDWAPFEAKVAAVGEAREAYGL